MCGRYESIDYDTASDLLAGNQEQLDLLKFGEVFPTNNGIVETAAGYTVMSWGIPRWTGSGVVFNARQETLLEKPFFRKDYTERRCVVLAKAFYEWRKEPGQKKGEKTIIYRPSQVIIKFAGLYKIIDDVPYYTIITQEANPEFLKIHNRQPLMLDNDEVEDYLKDNVHIDLWTHAKQDVDLSWDVV